LIKNGPYISRLHVDSGPLRRTWQLKGDGRLRGYAGFYWLIAVIRRDACTRAVRANSYPPNLHTME